jgi:hypothetical protein
VKREMWKISGEEVKRRMERMRWEERKVEDKW